MCEREPSGFPFAFKQDTGCPYILLYVPTHQTEKDA